MSVGVYFLMDCSESVSHKSFYSRKQVAHEMNTLVFMVLVKISLKIVYTQLVGIFESTVII